MPNAIDLTTKETAAEVLGISAADAKLPRLVTAASAAIASFVGYALHQQTGLTESVAGQGGRFLFLKAGAIESITSITIDAETVPADGYRLDSARMGRIARIDAVWPFTGVSSSGITATDLYAVNDGSVIVSFDAGYVTPGQKALDDELTVTLPAEIEQACLEVVTALYRRMGRDPEIGSMSLGGGSISYASKSAIPPTATSLLAPYKKLANRVF